MPAQTPIKTTWHGYHSLPLLALLALASTHGVEVVSGWSLSARFAKSSFTEHGRVAHNSLQNSSSARTLQKSPLPMALNVRGGSDETGDESNNSNSSISTASDLEASVEIDLGDDEKEHGSKSDENQNEQESDEMQNLRKQWASIPAVPSIEYPTEISLEGNDDHNTLAEFDAIQQTDHQQHKKNTQQSTSKKTKAIILMDGFSPYHGQYLAHAAHHLYGSAVIHILSDFFARYLYQVEHQTNHLSSRLPDLEKEDEVEAWKSLLPSNLEICGIYCESDSGLADAERFGIALGLHPRCHDGFNRARRDKFLMNEIVREVGGLEVVKQKSCRSVEEAVKFAEEFGLEEKEEDSDGGAKGRNMVVVKPLRGVASDDVHLCSDLASVRAAFNKIHDSPIFGSATAAKHEQVLVQEFATGVEYAVDVVCKDGERKAAALWRYDKRSVNGAPFVYFGTQLVSAAEEDRLVERAVCEYVFKALDSLGVRWGISHVEVIADEVDGNIRVRLVEVNCRQHNTDFSPLTNACIGYGALDMVLAAHLGGDEEGNYPTEMERFRLDWDSVPVLPSTRAKGAILHFVSHVEGKISRIRHDVLEEMEGLDSVMDMHVYPQFLEEGNEISKTIDIRSDTGWAHLMNDDEDEFTRDYNRLVELMEEMFEVEE